MLKIPPTKERADRCKFICFMGMDGSGKSALSTYVFHELNKDYKASYIWWLEGDRSLFRNLCRKVGMANGSSNKQGHVETASIKAMPFIGNIFNFICPRLILFDYLLFGLKKVYSQKLLREKEVFILDRYIYDVGFALSKEFGYDFFHKSLLYSISRKFLPDPDLLFIIEIPPETSFERKPEEIKSLDNANLMWKRYHELYSLLDNLTKARVVQIDNTRQIDLVKKEILNYVLEVITG